MKSIDGSLVLITGGSSGIGLAIAQQLFAQGASVVILARDQQRLDTAREKIDQQRLNPAQKLGALSADVTDEPALHQALTQLKRITAYQTSLSTAPASPALVMPKPWSHKFSIGRWTSITLERLTSAKSYCRT